MRLIHLGTAESRLRHGLLAALLSAGLVWLPACEEKSALDEMIEEVEDEVDDAKDAIADEIDDHS